MHSSTRSSLFPTSGSLRAAHAPAFAAVLPLLGVLLLFLALCGCSRHVATEADTIDQDVAKAQATWKLSLGTEGTTSELPLVAMDIYLVDDPEQWPEIFEISGPEVTLVGAFPMDLHVGHETAFQRLIGKSVAIDAHGGDPHDPKNSRVRLGGSDMPVLSGTVTFERVSGKWAGEQGDQTLWGRVELRVPGAAGDRMVRGSFAVHAVTWS